MGNKKIPQRQCVGCSQMKNKTDLIRIIKTPEGEVILDSTGKKNGRGAYICAITECLKKARKTKGIERSLKVVIPDEVYENLDREMSQIDG